MIRRTVIGFGNLLMGDDGVGIQVVRLLADMNLPDDVELIDGAVASFEVLSDARDAAEIIIIDALAGGGQPGDLYQVSSEELGERTHAGHFPIHRSIPTDPLHLVRQLGPMPPVVIYGIEPGTMDLGLELSAPVASAARRAAGLIAAYLKEG